MWAGSTWATHFARLTGVLTLPHYFLRRNTFIFFFFRVWNVQEPKALPYSKSEKNLFKKKQMKINLVQWLLVYKPTWRETAKKIKHGEFGKRPKMSDEPFVIYSFFVKFLVHVHCLWYRWFVLLLELFFRNSLFTLAHDFSLALDSNDHRRYTPKVYANNSSNRVFPELRFFENLLFLL